jgi:predicted amidohydrolase YtcJ
VVRTDRIGLLIAALAAVCLSCHPAPTARAVPANPADLVFRNGAIYTVDAGHTWAQAVAVAGGRIVYVGPDAGAGAWIGPRTEVVDLQQRMLLPGFQDSHTHPLAGGLQVSQCKLDELSTAEQIVAAVRRCAEQHPERSWIRGSGWALPVFPNANPHKSLLDEAVPDRPVFLSAADGHSAWLSSRALAAAGITRETPDPPNGRIERDPKTGEPTGTLREAAISLAAKAVPPYTAEEALAGLRTALQETARSGITTVQDAAVTEKILNAYAELDRRGELTVRTTAAMRIEPEQGLAEVPHLIEMRKKFAGRLLHAGTAKLFIDGVIEAHTAALLEPYIGGPGAGDRGHANWEPEALNRLVAELDLQGFQIHTHAIGDRAVRLSLDAFEKARAANGPRDSRHQIAHLELIDPLDVPRFQRLGVIANFQPLWATADPYVIELTVPVLGPERSNRLYPLGSVARAGARMACGSDWPVSSMNVLAAIQIAITRRNPGDGPGEPWLPAELVDLPTILDCYTRGGAFANFQEHETGSIEVGKAADLVVLDHNLFAIPRTEIVKAKVLLTLVAGREVYRDAALPRRAD